MKRMALVWPIQRASKVDVARESTGVWMVSESLIRRYGKKVWCALVADYVDLEENAIL